MGNDEIARSAIAKAAEPQQHAADVPLAAAEPAPRPRCTRRFANRRHPGDVPGLLKPTTENPAT